MSRVSELLDELKAIHDAKNHDYAHSSDPFANFHEAERLGISPFMGCLVRMGDKYARICNLARYGDPAVKSESIVDTLKDMAVYSLIAVALYEEENQAKPKGDCFSCKDFVAILRDGTYGICQRDGEGVNKDYNCTLFEPRPKEA